MADLSNRSLDRGIVIMETLARSGSLTLAQLHRETEIPKSTIRRLLGTLQTRRIVRRSLSDQKYRINISMPASAGAPVPQGFVELIDIAMPILSELTKRVNWPSDLQIINDHTMQIIDSTRPLSPYHLYRGVVNRSLNIFGSATGLCCLAQMEDHEILERIKANKGDSKFSLARLDIDQTAFFKAIRLTRARKYGVRLATYLGETVLDDGLAAIAVPVFSAGRVFGAITLVFPRLHKSPDEIAKEFLSELNEAANQITHQLERYFLEQGKP